MGKEYVMELKQFGPNTWGYERIQELVRCKDCANCDRVSEWELRCVLHNGETGEEWFCSEGRKKELEGMSDEQ